MSLWDPEAAGNAAQFLRLDPKVMLEIRNQPFEGTKAVWIPYSDTGYTKAEVIYLKSLFISSSIYSWF